MNWLKNNKTLTVHSFEPIPQIFERLKSNIDLNGLTEIASLNNFALGEKESTFDFYFNPHDIGSSSMRNLRESEGVVVEKCLVKTMDSFVEENKIERLDLIKCDVEGSELFVFKGGIETLKKFKPIVFSEMLRKWSKKFGYHPNDIISLFSTIGYECFVFENKKLVQINEVTEDTVQTNFLFLNKEKHDLKDIEKCLNK